MGQLFTKDWIGENLSWLPEWQSEAFTWLANRIADKENTYPCVPGRMGFLAGNMRFAFLGDPRSADTGESLAAHLQTYGQCAREAGPYTSLVVFFETTADLSAKHNIAQFEQLFWSILSDVHRLDVHPWPADIAADPAHFAWEFCFAGEPYFVFCTTPRHVARRSRYSPYFTMTFQPRWVFSDINASTPYGRKLREIIRKRLQAYDDAPIHPALGLYGQTENHEWQQYFLRDDESTLTQCPFLHGASTLQSKAPRDLTNA